MQRGRWYALGFVAGCIALAFFLTRHDTKVAAAPDNAARAAGGIARCGTPDVDEKTLTAIRNQIAARQKIAGDNAAGPLIIPVQFIHITNGTQGQITALQRQNQINVLNDAFSEWGVQFTNPNAPIVSNNATWFNMPMGSATELAAKSALQVDPNTNLNFYTCNADNGNLLGWATFPFSLAGAPLKDGVVIHWQTLPGGTFDPYDLGQTATHEIGHWLGLYHTFQGGCIGAGDEVNDTVAHASPNYGCPSPGQNGACNAAQQAPIHNFMNYTDDACMTHFTAGQAARWQNLVSLYRPGLGGGGCECLLDCLRVSAPQILPKDLLPQLRVMRDNLLEKSADGRRLSRLYYEHSSEVFRIMIKDPVLAQRSIRAILSALPKDHGDSGQVVMSAELYDECLILMERLQSQAGDELTSSLEDVRAILDRRTKTVGSNVVLRFPADRPQVAAGP